MIDPNIATAVGELLSEHDLEVGNWVADLRAKMTRQETKLDEISAEFSDLAEAKDNAIAALEFQVADLIERSEKAAGDLRAQIADQVEKIKSTALEKNWLDQFEAWRQELEKDMAHRIEVARLDADLWRANARLEIDDIKAAACDGLDNLNATVEDASKALATLNVEALSHRIKAAEIDEKTQHMAAALPRHVGGHKSGATYKLGDEVCYDGSTYRCVVDETDLAPKTKTEAPVWRLVASKGDRGPRGSIGPRGAAGKAGEPGNQVNAVGFADGKFVFVMSSGETITAEVRGFDDYVESLVEARLAKEKSE